MSLIPHDDDKFQLDLQRDEIMQNISALLKNTRQRKEAAEFKSSDLKKQLDALSLEIEHFDQKMKELRSLEVGNNPQILRANDSLRTELIKKLEAKQYQL